MKDLELKQKVYAASCSGLDIITSVCPEAAGVVSTPKRQMPQT